MNSLDASALKKEKSDMEQRLRNRDNVALAFTNIYSLVDNTFTDVLKEDKDTWSTTPEAMVKIDSLRAELELKLDESTNMLDRVYYKAKMSVLDEIVAMKEAA